MATPSRKSATIEDWLAAADPDAFEIVDGELVERSAMPPADTASPHHSTTAFEVVAELGPFRRSSGGSPGGWWLFAELHVGYGSELYCHDVAGYRRDRTPERPTGWPVQHRPDWVCEIVSPKHEKHDLVVKPRVLHGAGVPHYWVIDPDARILLVHRWSEAGYLVVQRAAAGEKIRAEPFDAIEIAVGRLFGDDD